jgi:DNA-binding Xre family transcriptional regulator
MKTLNPLAEKIILNLRQIIADKHITQATLASYADIEQSECSRMLNFKSELKLSVLANIATGLDMSIVDICTYPIHYVPETPSNSPVKAVVSLELSGKQREQVLSLLFGENKDILFKNS